MPCYIKIVVSKSAIFNGIASAGAAVLTVIRLRADDNPTWLHFTLSNKYISSKNGQHPSDNAASSWPLRTTHGFCGRFLLVSCPISKKSHTDSVFSHCLRPWVDLESYRQGTRISKKYGRKRAYHQSKCQIHLDNETDLLRMFVTPAWFSRILSLCHELVLEWHGIHVYILISVWTYTEFLEFLVFFIIIRHTKSQAPSWSESKLLKNKVLSIDM